MMMMTWSIFSIPGGSPGVEVPPPGLSTPPWACVQAAPTASRSASAAAQTVDLGGTGLMSGQESTQLPRVSPEVVRDLDPGVYALGLRPRVRA
jgi:hypothetical protein